ncbi:MAG TPA: TlpA disulfide reductase family protein [Mycobacteriales bacterium]|nr:TlpA disulfide reductase family protein [Mycobacteriales bacterium]
MTRPGRSRSVGLVVTMVAALVLAACSDDAPRPDDVEPTRGALPPIATDDCPAEDELLTADQAAGLGRAGLPDVRLPCIGSSRTVPLRRLGGLPSVVNLWASWCLPCRKEMPALQEVYAVAEGRVRFLGINVNDASENAARRTIQDTGIAYPSVRAEGRTLLSAVGVPGPPVTIFVDGDGRVVRREVGELTAAELRAKIEELLGVEVAPLR